MGTGGNGQTPEIFRQTIVLFTSNYRSGILQFTMQVGSTLSSFGYKIIIYVPDNAEVNNPLDLSMNIKKFDKKRIIGLKTRSSKKIAKDIEKHDPALVIFCDETIISSQVLLSLNLENKTAMFIHDVVPHIQRRNLYENLKKIFERRIWKYVFRKANKIILLSENSYNHFINNYSEYYRIATRMPLGAHIPKVELITPQEIAYLKADGYYLFFGRIGKYKGIVNLLKAYIAINGNKPLLVIAGSGELQPEEKYLIQNTNDVVLINRYIEDGEMLYLIKNCLTVVLPYIEATQSGVLPIAYHFKIPVITSNVSGLVEFVENSTTGIICNNIEEMTNALVRIRDKDYRNKLGVGAYKFYNEKLDWSNNLISWIRPLLEK